MRAFIAAGVVLLSFAGATAYSAPIPKKSSQLFETTTVWTIHLRFTPEQYAALEPKGNGRSIFQTAGPRTPQDFGPGMFLGPTIMKESDKNEDGKISRAEIDAASTRWFSDWDKEKTGKLGLPQIRAGMNSTFAGGGGAQMAGIRLQGDEGRRNGLASAMGLEFTYVHADLEFEGKQFKDVAVRYKGNGTFINSRATEKKSFKIDLNQFTKGQKLAGITTLNLHNNVTDPSWMNEVLSHRLYRDAGVPAPRSAYAKVYVSIAGKQERKYLGLYSLVENVDKDFVKDAIKGKKAAILKPVTPTPFAYLGPDWAKYQQIYDPKTSLTPKQQQRIIDFCKLVDKGTDEEFAAQIGDYIDLNEFSRYMAVTAWLSTLDSILGIGQNFYVYFDQTNKFQFIPWDLDHSFGQFFLVGTQEQRDRLSIHRPWRGDIKFLSRIFKVEAFKKPYLERMADFSNGIFRPERIQKQVDEIAAAIRKAVSEEQPSRLDRFDAAVSGYTSELGPWGTPVKVVATQPTTRPDTRAGRPGLLQQPIKPFVTIRHKEVLDQLAGKSDGMTLDGTPVRPRPGTENQNNRPGFGPGIFLAPIMLNAFDTDKDGSITRDEFTAGFARWFDAWNTDKTGLLTEAQLRAGLNNDLATQGVGPFSRPPPR